jgi:hypothetical protein
MGKSMSHDDDSETPISASEQLLTAIVKKIRSEPLLFAIAIVLILVAFAAKASDLGANLSLFIFAITGLAALALIGYYVVAALHELQPRRTAQPAAQSKYNVRTSNSSGPVAIGDRAHAEQHNRFLPSTEPAAAPTRVAVSSLQADLTQRTQNLQRLQAMEALYPVGGVPKNIVTEIHAEQRAIDDIRQQLDNVSRK